MEKLARRLTLILLLHALLASAATAAQPVPCAEDEETLCLLGGRIRVTVSWINQHADGEAGVGKAVPLTEETGAFWFFTESNLEVMVKVLDGTPVNGKYWVGIASLSDVEFTVTVSDTSSLQVRQYHNEPGNRWGVLDTDALDDDFLDEGQSCGGLVAPGTPFQCKPGLFCESPDFTCIQQVDGQGVCTVVPDLCTDDFTPVCGCDGKTYSNDCERQRAGVSKAAEGVCTDTTQFCGGFSGQTCSTGSTCSYPTGLCQVADVQGICVPTPDACPAVFDPVCGCDGRTYGNDCELLAAGVAKDRDGSCDSALSIGSASQLPLDPLRPPFLLPERP